MVCETQQLQLNNSHVRPKKEINKLSKKSNPKPKRPCFICGVHQSALLRHFLTHKSDPRICEAFKLSKIERRKAFDSFKKQGIHQFNLNEVQNSFFAKSYKTRHHIKSGEDSCQALIPSIAIREIDKYNSLDNDFKLNILNVINNDEIGTLAKSDSIILMIGSRLYGKFKRRFDKKLEVEKSVRCSMRRLANIYNRFTIEKTEYPAKMLAIEQGNSGDMFLRGNIDYLKKAIENYTDKGEAKIKSDAVYDLNKRRNEKHKKPAQLPMEEDIQTIRNHIVTTMEKLTSEYEIIDGHSFIQLRDCACARLTIFNGRRGGEPARLTIKEWENALNNVWLDKQRIKNTLSENESKVTGTNNRHRLSTLVAGLGVSDAQMSLAYDHFGHSETINKTIYQAPAAHRQLLSTGKHLEAKLFNPKQKLF
nr:uncharacterized protein LOC124815988 [Hydra vulgaris]